MPYNKYTTARYLNFIDRNPLVDENRYRYAAIDADPVPEFTEARALLPQPRWDGHDDAIACWWKTWELAFRNTHAASPENGFIRSYIDTAFNGNLFLWDTVFILLFARYGQQAFNFQQTLDNFYARQHEDGFICRELLPSPGGEMFHHHDPASTGPNVFAWCEWDYYLNTGDRDRLARVFPVLLAYHRWLRKFRTWQDGSYSACGLARGMDNQVWSHDLSINCQTDHGNMSRIDATAQALLSARCLAAMAEKLGRSGDIAAERSEIDALQTLLNERFWDASSRFYCDYHPESGHSPVKSVGAFWTILAQAAQDEQLEALTTWLDDPAFNRPHRIPSMSSDSPDYQGSGCYWRGGVWPPTNYMVLRGLSQTGQDDLAYAIACNHHDSVTQVFRDTGTLWEFYAPEAIEHGWRFDGKPSRHDFVGWSGLGPIAVLLEYRFGLRPDVPGKRLLWDVRETAAFGVDRYPFGACGLLDLHCEARSSDAQKPSIRVSSNTDLTLELRWAGGRETLQIKAN